MTQRYFAPAWADIKNTPHWFGKLCLLGLVAFIPVFGPIAVAGYLLGWARDMAWGIHQPMPEHVFGNADGRQYSRGFFALVIAFLFSLVPNVVDWLGNGSYMRALMGSDLTRDMAISGQMPTNTLVDFIVVLLDLAVWFFIVVGVMRMSVYGRLSPGLQVGKIWKMIRHDDEGLWRILGMELIVSVVCGLVLVAAIAAVVMLVFFFAILLLGPSLAGVFLGMGPGMMGSGMMGPGQTLTLAALGPVAAFLVVVLVGLLVYAVAVMTVFVYALAARALGYWTMRFDVPLWRGQDDPMPFEEMDRARQQQASSQAPQQPFASPAQAPAQTQQAASSQAPTAPVQPPVQQSAQPAAPQSPSVAQRPTAPGSSAAPEAPLSQQQSSPDAQNAATPQAPTQPLQPQQPMQAAPSSASQQQPAAPEHPSAPSDGSKE